MKYDKTMLDEMANKIDLVDYASNICEIKRKSGNYYTSCFIHDEKTPSLCIFPKTNSWYCFGCGAGGNIYNFIMKYENISFQEAVEKVANLTSTDVNSIIESDTVKIFKSLKQCNCIENGINTDRKILDFQKDYIQKYADELPEEWIKEGILPDILKKFNIRIDKNSNRIVYPMFDNAGNYLTAKGRSRLDKETIKALKIPKYISFNSINNVDFFCGMKENYNNIRREGRAIIFEGIKSVMHVIPWGYDYGLSSETRHLNDEQVKILIKIGLKEVIIAYDKDIKLEEIIPQVQMLKKFMSVSVIYDKWNLIKDKDSPCDQGKEIFDRLFNNRILIN